MIRLSAWLAPTGGTIASRNASPLTIRHLHTTFRVKKVRELFSSPAERERALEALVDDLGWRLVLANENA